MTPRPDPYRVLGLVHGASAGEIRSAYRRLAKLHHPDTAGDRSVQRFLAIQAAYEALVDGDGRLRPLGWPARGTTGRTRAPNAGAKGASRDAWRARQAGRPAPGDRTSGGTAGTGGAGDGSGRSAAGSRAGRGPGPSGSGPRPKGSGGDAPGGPRGAGRSKPGERRTARPGSTTYDEAAQPLDPSWEGAAWYGASSGRYWTLNPREYADPRKHGPEYQERARRAARGGAAREASARNASRRAGPAGAARADDEPSPGDPAEP